MRDLPVAESPGSVVHAIDVPLAGLVSGDYRVDIVATSGTARTTETVAFRVTP